MNSKDAVGTVWLNQDGRQLMEEIEELRQAHGVRRSAAIALVAERRGMTPEYLDRTHFLWSMWAAGVDVEAFTAQLDTLHTFQQGVQPS